MLVEFGISVNSVFPYCTLIIDTIFTLSYKNTPIRGVFVAGADWIEAAEVAMCGYIHTTYDMEHSLPH